MSLKNYYKILGVSSDADVDAIRNAYRGLAKKYHPDAAPDNPFAAAHFAEIAAAYEVLSNPKKRAQYDEERWLRGLSDRKFHATSITPDWVLAEAVRLRKHMAAVDTYRMNHAALADYVMLLLAPQHLSVLRDNAVVRAEVLREILQSTQKMHYRYVPQVAAELRQLAEGTQELEGRIIAWEQAMRREAAWNRYRPLLLVLFGVFICLVIWLAR